jgi:LIVCS family branched-chain amino acid:cation transporter
MAGVGLTLLYLALFRLGSDSATLVDQSANGAAILHAYVQHTFGGAGSFLLAALIFIACLVTAVGLTCACAVLCPVSAVLLSYAGVYPRPASRWRFPTWV